MHFLEDETEFKYAKKCAEDFVTRTRLLVLIGKFLIDLRIKKII
ncbi:hypothetical protein LEP1GSC151_2283 [Leptospira interrogans serovar Grippotyphosa str. LT2186]|uniref:Uncharacterized protein n=1 Tax=Leptospira interrogans serovar Grippotyphosa str. LT2186 TaxID=1001599 RepID=M3FS50_LEPIR|nr:hypothetical protein LEP1GSC151_2283 [Leptospira interrogans serovar Grippotyphosa str. LT2186]